MNWITHFDDIEWKIESTATLRGDDFSFYRWEKSFLKVTFKPTGGGNWYCWINGEKYTFYKAGDYVILELTDNIRSFSGGEIEMLDYDDRHLYSLIWVAIEGERPTLSNIDKLPMSIPIVTNFTSWGSDELLPFWFQITEKMERWNLTNWVDFYINNEIVSFNISLDYNDDAQHYRTKNSNNATSFVNLPCHTDMILFEWVGRFGVLKSWWFKIERTIYESKKTLDLQTLDNGFRTLKDKATNLIISHRQADNLTQNYLSDIVLSDEVFCYPDKTVASKLQVKVETGSFEVATRKRDIVLTINKHRYDTI